jgi:ATP/maltotriose-dependent transcriptional regulator MalT
MESAIVIAREIGNRQSEGLCLHNLGEFQLALGDLQASRDYYAQSLTIATEIGFRLLEANARWGQAQIEHRAGNIPAAIALAIHEAIEASAEA